MKGTADQTVCRALCYYMLPSSSTQRSRYISCTQGSSPRPVKTHETVCPAASRRRFQVSAISLRACSPRDQHQGDQPDMPGAS